MIRRQCRPLKLAKIKIIAARPCLTRPISSARTACCKTSLCSLPLRQARQKAIRKKTTGCRYSPRILALQKGERLRIRNNDPKLHIPHSYHEGRTVFNLSLPFKGTIIDATSRIRQAGVLKVVCDTHAWMLAYIHVFDHPYYAITDERGMFAISNLPAGTYVLKAWHEDAGVRSQEIIVPEARDIRTTFEFTKKE